MQRLIFDHITGRVLMRYLVINSRKDEMEALDRMGEWEPVPEGVYIVPI